MKRGQGALEGLLAFAIFIIALSLIAHASKGRLGSFLASIEAARKQVLLSNEAFYIDSAAEAENAVLKKNITGLPWQEGTKLCGFAGIGRAGAWQESGKVGSKSAVCEPLFSRLSADIHGRYYVRKER